MTNATSSHYNFASVILKSLNDPKNVFKNDEINPSNNIPIRFPDYGTYIRRVLILSFFVLSILLLSYTRIRFFISWISLIFGSIFHFRYWNFNSASYFG